MRKLSIFNSITRKIEVFEPLNPKLVTMYVCGPTVYNDIHIGNARTFVIYDLLYRILRFLYGRNSVKYVRNITDIDDKIINAVIRDRVSIQELTNRFIKSFHNDVSYLGCLQPDVQPYAMEHIQDMIHIIEKLLALGFAYIADSHVYFSVSKYKAYTKLSNRELSNNIENVRIDKQDGKRNVNDFVLWKPSTIDEPDSVKFKSPFGVGRPGWHIECSAMSHKHLGESFDIHGGGIDLIFPHHSNEIAQSICAFPNSQFARFWVHSGFLTVNRQKMSKSLNNFTTVNALAKQNVDGEVLRLFLISTRYNKPIDYNPKANSDTIKMLEYWYKAVSFLSDDKLQEMRYSTKNDEYKSHVEKFGSKNAETYGNCGSLINDFTSHLLDNMNTHMAINAIDRYARKICNISNQIEKMGIAEEILYCANFLGVMHHNPKEWIKKNVQGYIIMHGSESLVGQLNYHQGDSIKENDTKENNINRDIVNNYSILTQDIKSKSTGKIAAKNSTNKDSNNEDSNNAHGAEDNITLNDTTSTDIENNVVNNVDIQQISTLIEKREQARQSKNWQVADQIRNELESMGIRIIDKKTNNLD